MVTSSDAEQQPPKPDAPVSPTSTAAEVNTSSQSRSFLPSMALFLALIGIICSLYALYMSYQGRQSLHQQSATASQKIAELKQAQKDNRVQLNETVQTFEHSQSELQKKINTLHENLQSALKEPLYQNNDWLLLKARYYLEMAQINVHWSQNLEGSLVLLQQADALLAQIHEPRLFQVRQSLAKEINQLKAVPPIDTAGLLSKVDALQDMVASLPLKQALPGSEKNSTPALSSNGKRTWRERLYESVNLLEKLVVVRHYDEDAYPLISPAQDALFRENIRLNLEEVQWAIMQGDDKAYQILLNQAIKNTKRSFDLSAKSTQLLLNELQKLQKISLDLKKPSLEESLSLLNQLINSPRPSDKSPAPSGENSQ